MASNLPFGYTHRQKRSHAQMELEGSSSPTWSNLHRPSASRPSSSASHSQASNLHLPYPDNMFSAPPRRYPGDGFDYRRPVTSANVIDLTVEDAGPSAAPSDRQHDNTRGTRPPRFGRDIMRDVIDVEEEAARRTAAPADSPEIEFISSRPIDPPRRPTYGRNNAEEDEVEFVRENTLPESQRRRHPNANFEFVLDMFDDPELRMPHLRAQLERRAAVGLRQRLQQSIHRDPSAPPRRGRGHIHMGFVAPTLNFGAVGFDLGYAFEEPDNGPAPPPPTYNAPEKAPVGFTRSPTEEGALVCPNCGDELCVGDTDEKKQVWIVKGCGHVYCGECTNNRYMTRSAKGKERLAPARTKPFKECVVDGCNKRVSTRTNMFQIFL